MFDDISKLSPLRSELEWMLQSGQVTDTQVAEALIHQYGNELYGLVERIIGDPALAEIAFHESIAAAVTNRHRYWGENRLKVWLFRMAYKACHNIYQREKIQGWQESSTKSAPPSSIPTSGTDMKGILDGLSKRQQVVLLLRYVFELDVLESSKVLNSQAKNVQSLLHQARQPLHSLRAHSEGERSERNDESGSHFQFSGNGIDEDFSDQSPCKMAGRITDAFDGLFNSEADGRSRQELEAHLKTCPRCNRHSDDLRAYESRLKRTIQTAWILPSISGEERQRLISSVSEQIEQKGARRRISISLKEVLLTGAAVMMVVAFSWWGNFLASDGGPITSNRAAQANSLPTNSLAGEVATANPDAGSGQGGAGVAQPTGRPAGAQASSIADQITFSRVKLHFSTEAPNIPEKVAASLHWNNSGPVYLYRLLEYWGWKGDLVDVLRGLQPNLRDENVQPYELVNYVEEQTSLKAAVRVGGDLDTIKLLIEANFPVLIQKSIDSQNQGELGWMGQYEIVNGFDERRQSLIVHESYFDLRDSELAPYNQVVQEWQAFNYTYLVVYRPDQEQRLMNILGPQADVVSNFEFASEKASMEILHSQGLRQYFAFFNRGTNLVNLQDFRGAAKAYDHAFEIYQNLQEAGLPWRILWYQTRPYWAYFYTGRYDDVVQLSSDTLEAATDPILEESYYWRALAREAKGDVEGAIADLEESVRLNPNFTAGLYQLERINGGS